MPLSAAGSRRLVHTRDIQLSGYLREDGQIEVEARMRDTKSFSMETEGHCLVASGEPLHDMRIRLALTPDELEITACEAAMDATPYKICPQTAPKMERLVGLKIGKGFLRSVALRVGGVEGCTHLRELMQPIATVAFQTQYSLQNHGVDGKMKKDGAGRGPGMVNSCHAYAEANIAPKST